MDAKRDRTFRFFSPFFFLFFFLSQAQSRRRVCSNPLRVAFAAAMCCSSSCMLFKVLLRGQSLFLALSLKNFEESNPLTSSVCRILRIFFFLYLKRIPMGQSLYMPASADPHPHRPPPALILGYPPSLALCPPAPPPLPLPSHSNLRSLLLPLIVELSPSPDSACTDLCPMLDETFCDYCCDHCCTIHHMFAWITLCVIGITLSLVLGVLIPLT